MPTASDELHGLNTLHHTAKGHLGPSVLKLPRPGFTRCPLRRGNLPGAPSGGGEGGPHSVLTCLFALIWHAPSLKRQNLDTLSLATPIGKSGADEDS